MAEGGLIIYVFTTKETLMGNRDRPGREKKKPKQPKKPEPGR